jgi:hypothetical protein
MSLMFARLAHNFVKAGYFPTDEETLARVINTLSCDRGPARLLDPCCGEGSALADIAHSLRTAQDEPPELETLGVEFDAERAWHAKTILTRVIHADLNDVVVGARSVGLMFLNPPYGYGVSDRAGRNAGELHAEKAERLERTFLRLATPMVAYGGVPFRTTRWTMKSARTWRAITRICGFTWPPRGSSGNAWYWEYAGDRAMRRRPYWMCWPVPKDRKTARRCCRNAGWMSHTGYRPWRLGRNPIFMRCASMRLS